MQNLLLTMMLTILFAGSCYAEVLYIKSTSLGTAGSSGEMNPFGDLQNAIDQAQDGDTLIIEPGVYSAKAQVYHEELCGNCQEHRTLVIASRGFLIEGKALTIVGSGVKETTLITNAGY